MIQSLKKQSGQELRRRRQTFHATNTGSYVSTSSSQVRIEINVDKEVIDFETGYLMFDIEAAKPGSTDMIKSQPFDASSWIENLRVYDRAGREIGEQVRHYNAFARKHFELLGNSNAQTAGNYLDVLEGAQGQEGDSSSDQTLDAQERAHKFLTHIFDIKSYFPAHLMGGLIIELDMAATNDVIYLGGVTDTITSYTISNVRYCTDLVLLKPEAEAQLRGQLQNGLEIHYDSPMNHKQAVTTSTSQRFDLGVASGKVKNIQTFMVLDADTNTIDEESFPSFKQNGLTSYRFKQGSEWLTEKDVQVTTARNAECLVELLKSMNLETSDIVNFYGDSGLNLANRFVLGQKCEVSKDPSVSSGRRDYQSNKIELEMNFTGAAAATLYTNIMLEKKLVMLPGRQFKNVD
jgi:hypothetical protein